MTFSVATLAQQLESRRQAVSVVGSLLVHVGFAVYLLQPAPSASIATDAGARGDPPGAVTVSLFRSTSQPASSVRAPAPSTPAAVPVKLAVSPLEATSLSTPPPPVSGPETPSAPSASSTLSDGASGASSGQAVADVSSALGSDYQRRLLAHIEPFKRYPDDASRTGAHGVVQLVFEIDREGRVLGVWVARSSGSQMLDRAAVDTVRRAAPLPPIPTGLPDAFAVQLPVEFNGPG